ncbi:Phosphoribosyl-ATP pyrophosphatase [Candidatus Hodgkinia cicadicola]|nr:Phosphoribosyl-ATP pyrophosphatase [Candidatus Hodgkinia cicadicola]
MLVFVDLVRRAFASGLLTPRSFKPGVISCANAGAGWTRNGFGRKTPQRQPTAHTQLRNVSVVVESAVIAPDNKGMRSGLCVILKEINKRSAELALAACAQRSNCVILSAAGPVSRVVLVLSPLNASFESITNVFRNRANAAEHALGVLARLAVCCYGCGGVNVC